MNLFGTRSDWGESKALPLLMEAGQPDALTGMKKTCVRSLFYGWLAALDHGEHAMLFQAFI